MLINDADESSMKIFDLVHEFQQIMVRTDLARKGAVVSLCENAPKKLSTPLFQFDALTHVISGQASINGCTDSAGQAADEEQIVEQTSAVLGIGPYVVLDSRHLKLNKFSVVQKGNYVSVSSHIARIAAQSPQLTKGRGERDEGKWFRIRLDVLTQF
jgi:hypothetical protein